jgi:hypothetical protein
MMEQHIIIDSEQTIEAMLAPVSRDLLHYPCNNPPDAGKHCAKFMPSAALTIIITPLTAKSSYRPKRANCSAYSSPERHGSCFYCADASCIALPAVSNANISGQYY